MVQLTRQPVPSGISPDIPAGTLARRLAAAGLGVQVSRRRDTCELTILRMPAGKSLVALGARGQARWYYEPAPGPSAAPAALTAIIAHLLGGTPPHEKPGGLPRAAPQRTGRPVPAGPGPDRHVARQ